MAKTEPLPEDLRCNRTDGRKWRCNRPVMENKKLCEIHHLQGRHRQHKEKVPDFLKLERKPNRTSSQELGVWRKDEKRAKKRKILSGFDENFDGSLREIEMSRGDLKLDLIREFLKREVVKRKERKIQESEEESDDLVIAKTLSQSGENLRNAGGYSGKGGLGGLISCSLDESGFGSKNDEPILSTVVETLNSLREAKLSTGGKRMKCHWCHRSSYHTLVKCTSCHKQFFCEDCIKARCLNKQELKMACPVCIGTCNCRACLTNQSNDGEEKDYYNDDTKLLHYLIHVLLPVIAKVNHDQIIELEFESIIKGKRLYELHIPQIKCGYRELPSCNNCKASVVDFHRSCTRCSYNICLSCCRESRQGQSRGEINENKMTCLNGKNDDSSDDGLLLKRRYNTSRQGSCRNSSAAPTIQQKLNDCADKNIPCPDHSFDGFVNNLELRSVFPFGWLNELQSSVEEIVDSYVLPKTPDYGPQCSICRKTDHRVNRIRLLQETARRTDPSDNFLYYPTVQDLRIENLEHFQKHWGKGHPVILRNLIKSTSKLSWDPFIMFYNFLGLENSNHQNYNIKSNNCLDWCEVEICNKKTFMGSLDGHPNANVCRDTVKFRGWLSPQLFQQHFPAHHAAILDALPLKEYINPECGILNLALKLPNEMPMANLGPCIYLTYGAPEELAQANFLTRLSYESYDVVNILAHATDVPINVEELNRLRELLNRRKEQDNRRSKADATGQPLENQLDVTSMIHREDVEEMTRKISLYSEDTEESVSQDVTAENLKVVDEVLMPYTDLDRGCAQTLIDLNIPVASEPDVEYDSEATVSATIQGEEDSENESFFHDNIENSGYDDNKSASSCGAVWDIFRREDVQKLLEYLTRYSNELTQAYGSPKEVVHPILDQSLFLDAFNIMRLKEEFHIEPWTFKQNIGEAVMIPAGCPYQVRKLKSCVNIALEFISPENAHECIRLAEELRLLPQGHKAKVKIPEVENMTIYGMKAAVKEIKQSYTSRVSISEHVFCFRKV
ncbi:lysine-specific demethylase JMJ28 isoform X2 [Daucus carota subsp. sativus]|uniref:lysine-specific demethylase JMJ28 isoform X2 n=1 Tax=Daucus carota subsp. sativus TaxID=79200 RepID=UPI00308328AC